MPALAPTTGQLLARAVVITPIALVRHGIPSPLPSALALGSVLALVLLGTALAYVLLYWLMERLSATRTLMVTYLLPPFALVYGTLFLHEPIRPNTLIGLVLVVAAILLANGRIQPANEMRKPSAAGPEPRPGQRVP